MKTDLPDELIRSLSEMDHFDPDKFLSIHESGDKIVSVHFNAAKSGLSVDGWSPEIKEPPFKMTGKVPWCADSYYISDRPSFTMDPFFHAGLYYVQEASGLFLSCALKQIADLNKDIRVLDLCAAPGGKSTLLQSLISRGSLLVSNEVIKTRVSPLNQNMTKWGYVNGVVSNNDPAHFKKIPGFFDVILIDAPCSGSGLFRKNPEASNEWSTGAVNLCSLRQQRIIGDAWHSLKDDGFLIYTTCSYSKEENEDILDYICQQFPGKSVRLFPEPTWNIVETLSQKHGAYGYRFYPYNVSGEGFFLSVIQKKQEVLPPPLIKTKKSQQNITRTVEQQLKKWQIDDSHAFIPIGEGVHAFPENLLNDLEVLKSNLYLKKAGIRMGKSGEKEWIPDHELALANFLWYDKESIDISKTDALNYLRGQSFDPGMEGRGWRIVSYQKQHLGWVKLLEKRINNYYPKSWRIHQQDIF